jgi:hypothetical protein
MDGANSETVAPGGVLSCHIKANRYMCMLYSTYTCSPLLSSIEKEPNTAVLPNIFLLAFGFSLCAFGFWLHFGPWLLVIGFWLLSFWRLAFLGLGFWLWLHLISF